ncbi:MAG TPA: response regulator [Candidatus Udaeobacter sp.]|jgi:DNA-binding response OmpR family regulator
MKSNLILLLTEDIDVEEQSVEAARKAGAGQILTEDVDEAIEIVSARGREIDLAIIDFDNGCHGMTLLSTLSMLRDDLPIVVVTSTDTDHVAALAYANGAAACVAKPINGIELEILIRALGEPQTSIRSSRTSRSVTPGLECRSACIQRRSAGNTIYFAGSGSRRSIHNSNLIRYRNRVPEE